MKVQKHNKQSESKGCQEEVKIHHLSLNWQKKSLQLTFSNTHHDVLVSGNALESRSAESCLVPLPPVG